jgi:integrase
LSAWLERYEQSRVDVKEETRETYRHAGAYLLVYFDQDPPVDRISRADAGDWYSALASGELTKDLNAREDAAAKGGKVRYRWRKLSLSTVRRHARAAKQMFQVAVDEDRILFNPFDRLKASPPKPHKAWREVTPVDLERILESCPNMSWKCLFALCRLAGLRRNEALSLEWSHVDWSGNRMRIHEGLEHDTTKKRFRVCPIEPARCPTGLTALLRAVARASRRRVDAHLCRYRIQQPQAQRPGDPQAFWRRRLRQAVPHAAQVPDQRSGSRVPTGHRRRVVRPR